MINGKFFTGLTDKMMSRNGAGPNRQESHLYWPDESNTPSVRDSSHRDTILATRRRQSCTPSTTTHLNNAADDVAPKDLFRKHMKSRIEFYDHVDTTKDPPLVSPLIDKGFQDQKRQTLSSKIEFYDYVNEPTKLNISPKKVQEKKPENTPKSPRSERKISFKQNASEKPKISTKEHIIPIKNDDISKKSNISKKNISKSVENLTLKDDEDIDLDLGKLNKQVQNLKITPKSTPKVEPIKSKVKPILKTRRVEIDQEPEEFVYRNGYDYDELPPVRVIKSRAVRPEEDYFYENRIVPAAVPTYRHPHMRPELFDEEPVIVRRPIDRFYYQPREIFYREPEPRRRTVKYAIPDDEDYTERPPREPPQRPRSPSPAPAAPKSRPIQRSNTVRETTKPIEAPNEARLRAHQHLKSSISFYNDTTTAANASERKPLSIRDTAVARVGVGLPDI
ncbi:muscle M-line assembly protein unc-89-like isoform X2 [Lutzomyia longipalpis]|uniref:muscle M-line assembly protein unc-89-like isoform X2 n=1 Tax=Lutzomyia longipalpis TaxID=7200 RepID=UPI0024835EF6|nr:muscle M-line assembly protein unc-89-like isoform X2 [Lutzomyia longipalpis]